MFHETEFFGYRNEFLYEEKCKYLFNLMNSIINDPELPKILDEEKYELRIRVKLCYIYIYLCLK